MTHRTCSRCRQSLPETEEYFYRNEVRASGEIVFGTVCKVCQCERNKRYRNRMSKTMLETVEYESTARGRLYLAALTPISPRRPFWGPRKSLKHQR